MNSRNKSDDEEEYDDDNEDEDEIWIKEHECKLTKQHEWYQGDLVRRYDAISIEKTIEVNDISFIAQIENENAQESSIKTKSWKF